MVRRSLRRKYARRAVSAGSRVAIKFATLAGRYPRLTVYKP
jgi:hypothetical protein